MKEYSAGFTSEGWFQSEMTSVLSLKLEGLSREELLGQALEKNLFQLRSESSIKKRFQMVYRRSETLNVELSKLFLAGSRLDQKALLLYSFLKGYRLPLEFLYEVLFYNYRNNKDIILGVEIDFFIERKENESEKVAGWRLETKKRLRSAIILFFREGGLLQEVGPNTYKITPIHLSNKLKEYAKEHDKLLLLISELR
jgi:hypothetical protein